MPRENRTKLHRIGKFFRLSVTEQRLLLQATILLATIRLGLFTLPFASLRSMLARLAATGNRRDDQGQPASDGVERTVWAVETVGRHFPAIGTCLTQALAAHVMLARRGHQSNLRIGVARNADGKFEAHAWLEKDNVMLIGGNGSSQFTPMPILNGLGL